MLSGNKTVARQF